MGRTRWRKSTQVFIGVAMLAFVAAVVAAATFFTTGGHGTSNAHVPVPPPRAPVVKPGMVPVADTAETPSAAGLAAVLAPVAADPNLGRLGGRVTDAITGKELWQLGDDVPLVPASTNKVLTAAAALLTLDRQARISTRVVAGSQNAQGPIVLVGAGDPTLSAAPPDVPTWYRGAPRISDLVEQVRRSGVTPTAVQVDTSAFTGPTLAQGWDPTDIDNGDIAPIESVMIDAGRIQPSTVNSRRSKTPALDAGRELAKALGMDPAAVTVAAAPSGARQLAVVQSAPLVQRLGEMMDHSDNVLAECIAREVAAAINRPRSFAGAVDAVTNRLSTAHIDTTGAALLDSSGLSVDDRLTAKTLDGTVQAAAGPDQPSLRALLDLLPIAGGSGTLAERFLDQATNQGPAGWLRAKTGSLTATNSLVGVVTDRSGRVLTFAFISNSAGPNGRNVMDALATRLWTCGCA
ncbi:D-alanyl-D-alanine carboxypeptidase/D-alanyl-D-alanine endopeptidase [Mycobacterium montefiorense]|uniref:D-alanyl-D-alanine carboxypeptidase/D-alanyl-D-alanine-endopeptidase n=1 Tax=Mycobacterium montefiorense TaxID=154654 RepID=A0AA37PPG1_9MYCO|nr:D-alanyl-D-alanine carboxypeptidase/D-alanyl-D-alanine-endopeptidase [Mycobacterium montefiorense]GBG36060.1 D-alanyl-D-alanine carboxypeptidase/D-alanyl-D-alanine-endopeptidase [Mycobacterium montefiorense]GKU34060.1 D-alanyl-D-alanine carboxypeptidase/D-alanyl-D-alanine-endopeptidase [Mycobacterium montefiorense]GKU41458.1 D-alanyl-D-alanine carboxypeptidase/D-alanyl-D-alanine-endopeptidase [Mycobacterium montefiorense]GKU47556.1 D-alanyl-D-alanine carboxypeptidase/D-alanyl-D-alanine-endop